MRYYQRHPNFTFTIPTEAIHDSPAVPTEHLRRCRVDIDGVRCAQPTYGFRRPTCRSSSATSTCESRSRRGQTGTKLEERKRSRPDVAQPAITLFAVQQRVVFEIQIPQAMNLYQAEKGYKPKTHNDFMNLIKANNINLPELPAGQVYKYDVEKGELWVYPAEPQGANG